MVGRLVEFQGRMRAIPRKVLEELRTELEVVARQLVSQMRRLNPLPGAIEIDWTWGKAPGGSIAIGRVAKGEKSGEFITVYATAKTEAYPDGFPAVASWFEFGTAERQTKAGHPTGKITASPYFFPVWRSERRRVKSRITRAVKRGLAKA